MANLFNSIWNLFLLAVGLGIFTCLADATHFFGREALKAHQQGLVKLPQLNRMLFGSDGRGK
jgi:hypothetical protein